MDKSNLQRAAENYEGLFKSHEKLVEMNKKHPFGDIRVAHILCELYAMMSAYQIRTYMSIPEEASSKEEREGGPGETEVLPNLAVVQSATRELLVALASEDNAGMAAAAERMGVLEYCPIPKHHFDRMESVARSLEGRIRLIPLVELSLFAVEIGDYERAKKYAAESRLFNPGSWELYNLCIVDGMIALNEGDIRLAIQQLQRSTRACQTDEYTSLNCGARAPNLMLAEELLRHGRRVEVLKYLDECHNVWQYLRPQIEEWVGVVENGGTPDFRDSKILKLNQFSYRLKMQWLSACGFDDRRHSGSRNRVIPKSPDAVLAGRERLRAEQERRMNAAISRQIKYLED